MDGNGKRPLEVIEAEEMIAKADRKLGELKLEKFNFIKKPIDYERVITKPATFMGRIEPEVPGIYAGMDLGPASVLCIRKRGRAMRVQEIFRDLQDGGSNRSTVPGKSNKINSLRAILSGYAKTGRFDLVKVGIRYSLKDFAIPASKPEPKKMGIRDRIVGIVVQSGSTRTIDQIRKALDAMGLAPSRNSIHSAIFNATHESPPRLTKCATATYRGFDSRIDLTKPETQVVSSGN